MVEAKYHEDKLKLQQQHDVAVQKVFSTESIAPLKAKLQMTVTEPLCYDQSFFFYTCTLDKS